MMAWHWFAVIAERPADAFAVADAHTSDGQSAGFLAAWPRNGVRKAGSLAIDIRAVNPSGEPAWVWLALAPRGVRVLFDDPAVSQALRDVLGRAWPRALSTLTLDAATIGGAITVLAVAPPFGEIDDPFARLFPSRLLHVGPGFLGEMAPPTGPRIQRYAGRPWPWDHF